MIIDAGQPFYSMFASVPNSFNISGGTSDQVLLIAAQDNINVQITPLFENFDGSLLRDEDYNCYEAVHMRGDSILITLEFPEDHSRFLVELIGADGKNTTFCMSAQDKTVRGAVRQGMQMWPIGLEGFVEPTEGPAAAQEATPVPEAQPEPEPEAPTSDWSVLNSAIGHWFYKTADGFTEYVVVEGSGSDYYLMLGHYASEPWVYARITDVQSASGGAYTVTLEDGTAVYMQKGDVGELLFSYTGPGDLKGFYYVGSTSAEVEAYYYS